MMNGDDYIISKIKELNIKLITLIYNSITKVPGYCKSEKNYISWYLNLSNDLINYFELCSNFLCSEEIYNELHSCNISTFFNIYHYLNERDEESVKIIFKKYADSTIEKIITFFDKILSKEKIIKSLISHNHHKNLYNVIEEHFKSELYNESDSETEF